MNNNEKIYVAYKVDATSLKNFIREYFDLRCPETYFGNGKIQCMEEKGRTIDDLLLLIHGIKEFEEVKTEEVAKILLELGERSETLNICPCRTIGTLSFHSSRTHTYPFLYETSLNKHNNIDFVRYRSSDSQSANKKYPEIKENTISFNDLKKIAKTYEERK